MAIKYKDMAIEFKKIQKDLKNAPLTKEELALIKSREDFIDEKIKEQFGLNEYNPNSVSIELGYPTFEYDMKGEKEVSKHKSIRKSVMQTELEKRYKAAGWKIEIEFDDGLDGPNMSGPDYWVLKGK